VIPNSSQQSERQFSEQDATFYNGVYPNGLPDKIYINQQGKDRPHTTGVAQPRGFKVQQSNLSPISQHGMKMFSYNNNPTDLNQFYNYQFSSSGAADITEQ
jgi:hypothetical protein